MNETGTDFRLIICGIDELGGHCAAKVTHVLSILDPATPEPDAFGTFGEHSRLELRFHDVIEDPTPGYDPPQPHHVESILAFGRVMTDEAERPHLLVHCHMGISRSTAAATLILAQANPDTPAAAILDRVVRVRPRAWPNLRMLEMGDDLLGRGGALVRAARARYRTMAEIEPTVAQFMRENGRARELR